MMPISYANPCGVLATPIPKPWHSLFEEASTPGQFAAFLTFVPEKKWQTLPRTDVKRSCANNDDRSERSGGVGRRIDHFPAISLLHSCHVIVFYRHVERYSVISMTEAVLLNIRPSRERSTI